MKKRKTGNRETDGDFENVIVVTPKKDTNRQCSRVQMKYTMNQDLSKNKIGKIFLTGFSMS